MSTRTFSRLIRFVAGDGKTYYGDAILPRGATDVSKTAKAKLIEGDIFASHQITGEILDVKKLLPPLAQSDMKTVRCLGLNYAQHAREKFRDCGLIIKYKPITSITGPSVIIGKEARDVSEDKALEYVLGYSVGNDVSHRDWQLKKGGGQWSLGKGFDGWAPIGPAIVNSELVPDPQKLRISTKVNGITMQDSSTVDMIFSVAKTISFLSQGTTLLPGDILFTGTPQGVGMGRSPQVWLKDGDVVEVSLENIGSITNKVVFEQPKARF